MAKADGLLDVRSFRVTTTDCSRLDFLVRLSGLSRSELVRQLLRKEFERLACERNLANGRAMDVVGGHR